MKQLISLLLSLIVALTMFSACSDEEGEDLLGAWKIEKCLADIKTKDGKAETEIKNFLEKESGISSMWETFIFKKNGKGDYIIEDRWGSIDFTYSTKGNELTVSFNKEYRNETRVFTYFIENNTLTMTTNVKALLTTEYLKNMRIENPESVEIEHAIFTRTLKLK